MSDNDFAFEFTEEQQMVRQMVRRWATEKLEPKVDAIEAGEPPYELMRDFAKSFGIPDLVGAMFERLEERAKQGKEGREKGKSLGLGADPAISAMMSIELCRVCPGFMLAFGASMGLAGGAIMFSAATVTCSSTGSR